MKCRTVFFYLLTLMVAQAGSPAPAPEFEQIHQGYVDWFVGRQEDGMSRMGAINPMLLGTERFSLERVLYSGTQIELVSFLKRDLPILMGPQLIVPQVDLPAPVPAVGPGQMHQEYVNRFVGAPGRGISRRGEMSPAAPTEASLWQMHDETVNRFVGAQGNGVSRSAKMSPVLPATNRFSLNGALYSVTQFDLVSLLKHDPPMAYVVNINKSSSPYHTESPVELTLNNSMFATPMLMPPKNYKLRALGEDEVRALKELREGKEIAMTDGGLMGAIRAQTSCINCHDCKEGDLLGAFSYSLKKEADLKDAARPGGGVVAPKAVESGTGEVK